MPDPKNWTDAFPDSVKLGWQVLEAARKAVPAVNYALGAAGVAAAGSFVVLLLGNGRGAAIVLGGMLIAMTLLFLFSRLLTSTSQGIGVAAQVLLWMVVVFFGVFLFFTTTAFAFRWPQPWASFLGIESDGRKSAEELMEVPSAIAAPIRTRYPTLNLLRLHPRREDSAPYLQRTTIIPGGGSFYAFPAQAYTKSNDADLGLDPGLLRVGFAGADYGFFMHLADASLDDLAKLKIDAPPSQVDKGRLDAWSFAWTFKPATLLADARAMQKRVSDGIVIGDARLSDRATVYKGALYLQRSIKYRRSDWLVGFSLIDHLSDGSVVLAWRVLRNYDTPILRD